jgi:hypothetical protein
MVTAFIIVIGMTVTVLLCDRRDRKKDAAFEDECREFWRARGYVHRVDDGRRLYDTGGIS